MTIKLAAAIGIVFLFALSSVSPVLAHAGHEHSDVTPPVPQSAEGQGTVKAIDLDGVTVTLAHGPIAALNWPAMTMTFKAESKSVIKDVQIGNNVHFTLQNEGGKPVVTEIHAE